MKKIYSPMNKGYESFTREQGYVSFDNNVAKKMDARLIPTMQLYLSFLASEKFSYNKNDQTIDINVNGDIVNNLYDKKGYNALDYMVYYAKYKAVKHLVENCNIPLNCFDNNTLTSTLLKAYKYIDVNEDKFLDRVKIFAYLAKKGAYAFSSQSYVYDDEVVANEDVCDYVHETIERVNIGIASELIYHLVDSLGKNENKDEEILIAIDCLSRVGFMPNIEIATHENFAKYNLYDLFDLSKKPILKISEETGIRMTELLDYYTEDNYLGRTQQVISANIYADTFTDEYRQQVDQALEESRIDDDPDIEAIENELMAYSGVGDEEDVSEGKESDEENPEDAETDEEFDDSEYDEDAEDDDDLVFDPSISDCLFGYENLIQIRDGNEKYFEKFPVLKDLKSNDIMYKKFIESVNDAETYTLLNELCCKNQKVIDQKMALLEDDNELN